MIFPFTAVVGQEEMKTGLIINVIDPSIGGLLIMGEKGTAKSTAGGGVGGMFSGKGRGERGPLYCGSDGVLWGGRTNTP